MADRHGLIVDYGGVLTTEVFASFSTFCEAEGLTPDAVRDRFREDPEARDLLARLETGGLAVAEFEPRFAALLGVSSERLMERLLGGMAPDGAMLDGVRAARATGVRIGLLSNSWGAATAYDPALLARSWAAAWMRATLEHRELVSVGHHDLRSSPSAGPFDVVLSRNAAFTYLSAAGQRTMLARLTGTLRPGGALVIGLHESLPEPHPGLAPWAGTRAIFRRA